jgi:perosamine synthetase
MLDVQWWSVLPAGGEMEKLNEVVTSGYFNEGSLVEEFESEIANFVGVKHAIACTSGTSALFLALKANGIGQGDKVLVPDMTFIASANAVTLTGAEVVLVDVHRDTLTIDIDKCEQLIDENVKAIIPVHVSGRSAWSKELSNFASKHGLKVIEDAAEALGSRDPASGKYLGTIGDAGIYSLSPNKVITSGQGGFVVTDDDEVESICRRLKDQGRPRRGTGGDDLHPYEGYNFKMTNLQAAVGISQFSLINERLSHFANVYNSYVQETKNCDHGYLMPFATNAGEIPLWPEWIAKDRNKIQSKLQENRVGYRNLWLPIHSQDYYKVTSRSFPNSEYFSEHGFWLPSAFDLTEQQIRKVSTLLSCTEC